jgi:hypothetical protein
MYQSHGEQDESGRAALGRDSETVDALANDILTAADEVSRRVGEWRDGPEWRDDKINSARYDKTNDAVAALRELPQPVDDRGLDAVAEAARPLLDLWCPSYADRNRPSTLPSSDSGSLYNDLGGRSEDILYSLQGGPASGPHPPPNPSQPRPEPVADAPAARPARRRRATTKAPGRLVRGGVRAATFG